MEYYSTTSKDELMKFASTFIELEGILLSEVSKREKNT